MIDTLKQDIIQVAMAKMRAVGIRSVSIDDVCHELGMSKKTFYVYFATKDELVEAMLLKLEDEVNANIQTKLEKNTILDLLLNFQKIMRETRDVRQVPPVIYDLEKYYPQLYQAHKSRVRARARINIGVALQRGKEEHIFREDLDVEKAGVVIESMRETILNVLMDEKENKRNVGAVKYAIDIVMRGIVSDEGKEMILRKMNG